MNSDRRVPENILYLKRCRVCEETFVGKGRCCSRACRIVWAELEEFWRLHFLLTNARWAGAPSEEQLLKEYFRNRLWDAVRRLPHSAELLAEVLIEIVEEG